MHPTAALRPKRRWLRVCLSSCLILGILAMLHILVADDSAHQMDTAAVMTAMQMDNPPSVAALVGDDGHADGDLSDCCGLMMLCVAMIAGARAFLLLRRRSADRVLWQLPPPFRLGNSLRLPPIHGLTPLQRSSILRC
jgi:hypothetical protein